MTIHDSRGLRLGCVVQSEDQALEARNSRTVVAVILGGGAGTRLFPLTKRRAKPAVSESVVSEDLNSWNGSSSIPLHFSGANWRRVQADRRADEQLHKQWDQQGVHPHAVQLAIPQPPPLQGLRLHQWRGLRRRIRRGVIPDYVYIVL